MNDSHHEYRNRLKAPPYSYSGTSLSSYGPLDVIANQIVIGDIIVCPHKDKIHFGVVTGDYTYDSTKDIDIGGYPHLRNVNWKVAMSKNNLPSSLANAIKVPRGVANLKDYLIIINSIINQAQPPINSEEMIEVNYPIRPDLNITVIIPKNLSQAEAVRLSDFIRALHYC